MRKWVIPVVFMLVTSFVWAQEDGPSIDIKWYNNLYSQTKSFDTDRDKVEDNRRSSFLTSILQLTLREKEKLNFGLDAYFRASRIDSSNGSPLKVLELNNDGQLARASLTHIGPKLVYTPDNRTWIRAIFLFPLDNRAATANPNLPFLDNTGYRLWLQYGRNISLADQWYLYLEGSTVFRFDRAGDNVEDDIYIPLKAFISWFIPSTPLGIFGFADYSPTITDPASFYFHTGGGIKLYPSDGLEIEFSGSKFLAGKSSGAGYTVNFAVGYRLDTSD